MSYKITPAHRAALERDEKKETEDGFLLRRLARNYTDKLAPLHLDDFTNAQKRELFELYTQGWIQIYHSNDWEHPGVVKINDSGLAKIFTESL